MYKEGLFAKTNEDVAHSPLPSAIGLCDLQISDAKVPCADALLIAWMIPPNDLKRR